MDLIMAKAKDKHYMGLVGMQLCILCTELGMQQKGRTYLHHIREGQGMSQRASNFLVIPLCYDCHQGPVGIHGTKALMAVAKVSELDLLALTIERMQK
jgi:hypothetical protein